MKVVGIGTELALGRVLKITREGVWLIVKGRTSWCRSRILKLKFLEVDYYVIC
jgi:hypothetical protein